MMGEVCGMAYDFNKSKFKLFMLSCVQMTARLIVDNPIEIKAALMSSYCLIAQDYSLVRNEYN